MLDHPTEVFSQAIVVGFMSFWVLLYVWHRADLFTRNIDSHEHAGMRHEALRMVVSLSILCCAMALLVPNLPQDRMLWLAGGSTGLWLACLHAFWLSANWWRGRTFWKVH